MVSAAVIVRLPRGVRGIHVSVTVGTHTANRKILTGNSTYNRFLIRGVNIPIEFTVSVSGLNRQSFVYNGFLIPRKTVKVNAVMPRII